MEIFIRKTLLGSDIKANLNSKRCFFFFFLLYRESPLKWYSIGFIFFFFFFFYENNFKRKKLLSNILYLFWDFKLKFVGKKEMIKTILVM